MRRASRGRGGLQFFFDQKDFTDMRAESVVASASLHAGDRPGLFNGRHFLRTDHLVIGFGGAKSPAQSAAPENKAEGADQVPISQEARYFF